MFTTFERDIDPKNLYFKLNNSFQITSIEHQSPTSKFAGLYAIYKNDICYYVGQSQNLASRICQHINGKYASAGRIEIFLAKANGFGDFHLRSKESRKSILESNENSLIRFLKPIENLMLPSVEFSIDDDALFVDLGESNITVVLEENYISTSKYSLIMLDDVKAMSDHNEYIIHMAKDIGFESARKEFC